MEQMKIQWLWNVDASVVCSRVSKSYIGLKWLAGFPSNWRTISRFVCCILSSYVLKAKPLSVRKYFLMKLRFITLIINSKSTSLLFVNGVFPTLHASPFDVIPLASDYRLWSIGWPCRVIIKLHTYIHTFERISKNSFCVLHKWKFLTSYRNVWLIVALKTFKVVLQTTKGFLNLKCLFLLAISSPVMRCEWQNLILNLIPWISP